MRECANSTFDVGSVVNRGCDWLHRERRCSRLDRTQE
jgi:hypothetical protein